MHRYVFREAAVVSCVFCLALRWQNWSMRLVNVRLGGGDVLYSAVVYDSTATVDLLLSTDSNVRCQLSQPTLTDNLGTAVFCFPDCGVYV